MRLFNGYLGTLTQSFILLFAVGLSACTTTLTASKVDNFAQPYKGQIYYLPRAEYQISVTRELNACSYAYRDDSEAALAWLNAQLQNARGADTEEQALEIFNRSISDPALQRGDIKSILNKFLPADWQTRAIRSVPPTPPKKGKKAVPVPAQQEVVDDVLDDLIRRIRNLQLKPELKFDVELSAQVVASFLPDASQTYSLDYELMSNGLKTTDYTVETYDDGRLKSVNVTVDDQTGPAIISAIGGVTKIAAAASGFALPASVANAGQAIEFQSFSDWKEAQAELQPACKAEIRWRLYQRAGLKSQSEASAQGLLVQQKAVDKLDEAQVKALAARDRAKAALEELDASDPKRPEAEALVKKTEGDVKLVAKNLLDERAKLATLTQAGARVDTRLAAVRKGLTLVHAATFRPTTSDLRLQLPGDQEVIRAWLAPNNLDCAGQAAACVPLNVTALAVPISAYAHIFAPSLVAALKASESGISGIPYRQPLKATMIVCRAVPCVAGGSIVAPNETILVSSQVAIPQLGAMAVLPLTNGAFQNNTISASFAENGALTKLAYKSNAAVAKAAEVFESSADALMKFRQAKRGSETSKLEANASELAAKKKVIDAQLALEKSQADLDKFREAKPEPASE